MNSLQQIHYTKFISRRYGTRCNRCITPSLSAEGMETQKATMEEKEMPVNKRHRWPRRIAATAAAEMQVLLHGHQFARSQ
jgi:hypothetical protein